MENFYHNYKNRKSIRLPGYDYSEAGYYFVTVCIKEMECFLGKIKDNKMSLSEIGEVVRKCIIDIPNHYPTVRVDDFVVMPNHVHFILDILPNSDERAQNVEPVPGRGAGVQNIEPVRGRRAGAQDIEPVRGMGAGVQNIEPVPGRGAGAQDIEPVRGMGAGAQDIEPVRGRRLGAQNLEPIPAWRQNIKIKKNAFQKIIPGSLGCIVRGFKIGVTKWCRNNGYEYFSWHRNYYEQIIRNQKHLQRVINYIENNPKNWHKDDYFD